MIFIDKFVSTIVSSGYYYTKNPQFIIDNTKEVLNLLNTKYQNDINYTQPNTANTGTVYIPIEFKNLANNNPLKYGEIRIADHPRNFLDKRHKSIKYNVCPQDNWDKSLTHLQNQLDLVISANTREVFVITIDKKIMDMNPITNPNGTITYIPEYKYIVELKTKYDIFIGNSKNGVTSAINDAFGKILKEYQNSGKKLPFNFTKFRKRVLKLVRDNAADIEQKNKTQDVQMYFSIIDDDNLTLQELLSWVANTINNIII